jgi:hypothetical protein
MHHRDYRHYHDDTDYKGAEADASLDTGSYSKCNSISAPGEQLSEEFEKRFLLYPFLDFVISCFTICVLGLFHKRIILTSTFATRLFLMSIPFPN